MFECWNVQVFVSSLPRCIQIVFTPGAESWAEHYLDCELWLCEAQSIDGYETQRNQQAETLCRGFPTRSRLQYHPILTNSITSQINNQEWEMINHSWKKTGFSISKSWLQGHSCRRCWWHRQKSRSWVWRLAESGAIWCALRLRGCSDLWKWSCIWYFDLRAFDLPSYILPRHTSSSELHSLDKELAQTSLAFACRALWFALMECSVLPSCPKLRNNRSKHRAMVTAVLWTLKHPGEQQLEARYLP